MLIPKLWYVRGLRLKRAKNDLFVPIREAGRVERWGHRADIRHRDEPSEVYVVLSGSLDLQDGAHDIALRLRPGDIYGETGEGFEEETAIVRAYDDTTIAALDRSAFDDIAAQELGTFETQLGIVRRHSLSVPASMLLYTTPRRRVAKVLLHLVEQYGSIDGDRGQLTGVVRSRNLAKVSGLAPRSVSDIFDAMQRDHLVESGRTELVIPSLETMRELALSER